ncbi:retrovirus-related pol polyprotein from transposon TNT 1-94 [Tanacetum coccineum]
MATNEETNAAGTDTRPPMLVESDYESWKIRIHRDYSERKEDLFDEYETLSWLLETNNPDYFVRFHKLVIDMKFTQLKHSNSYRMNTVCQQLSAYWGNGFPKAVSPTNNRLRTYSNTRTHATVHDGQIVTEPVQRKAPGNNGNTGTRGKKVICYNCRGEGHVVRQCTEPKRKMDSQYFKDKALLMEAKEKGDVLDAEAEAFLADVECTAPYASMLLVALWQTGNPLVQSTILVMSEEVLVHQVVSMKKMNKKPGHVRPANGFYDKLNALMFVPQKDLSGDQAYWLSANENASQDSKSATLLLFFVVKSTSQSSLTVFEKLMLFFLNLKISATIVLTRVVPPSSNCLCEDLRSACDREHTKVLELEAEVLKQQKMVIESEKRNSHLQKTHIDLQLKFQNYKQCIDTSSASNAIFEINKLRQQLQGKDDTIRNLDAQINIMKVLNVGSTEGSCDQQALETDRIQLKDTITSLRIQLDGLKVENVSLKRRYDELSKANTHSRTAYTEKINALTAEIAKLKTELSGKKSGGSTASEKPKVLASGMYTKSSKYIPPPKRANWVKPTPLPKKKQVTFQEPPRTSNRPTQKPPVQQNKKPNVPVNLSTRTKPATESRKPMPKCHTRNHRILPNKSVNARRAADHNRKLNVVDHNQFVIRSLKSVNTKTPQAKHSVNHTKKVWKATRNHNVNTTKTAWRPTGKVVGSVKPQWKPTGRHFALYDNCPLTRIMEPIVEPLELTPSVSSSSKVTMISRFITLIAKLSDSKGWLQGDIWSKGRTVADSIAARLTRPTAYKFKTDCSIIPVENGNIGNLFLEETIIKALQRFQTDMRMETKESALWQIKVKDDQMKLSRSKA